MTSIDLNADVGEGYADEELLPLVSSVNIACGAHAGDVETMARIAAAAARASVAIGAHPGYRDRENFGRVALELPPSEVRSIIAEQVALMAGIAEREGARLSHVKPHGALYNQSAADPELARAIAQGGADVDPSLRVVGLAGSASIREAAALGLATIEEAFADRRYLADGTLAPRALPGAVVSDPRAAAAQAVAIALGDEIETLDGGRLQVRAGTICIHGDTPGAIANATEVRARLEAAGVRIARA